jgi:hypothetical protein
MHFVTKAISFEIYSKKGFFFLSVTSFSREQISPPTKPQSADRTTLDGLQRAETHFLPKYFFKNIILGNGHSNIVLYNARQGRISGKIKKFFLLTFDLTCCPH